jgi:hypothetical protein
MGVTRASRAPVNSPLRLPFVDHDCEKFDLLKRENAHRTGDPAQCRIRKGATRCHCLLIGSNQQEAGVLYASPAEMTTEVNHAFPSPSTRVSRSRTANSRLTLRLQTLLQTLY